MPLLRYSFGRKSRLVSVGETNALLFLREGGGMITMARGASALERAEPASTEAEQVRCMCVQVGGECFHLLLLFAFTSISSSRFRLIREVSGNHRSCHHFQLHFFLSFVLEVGAAHGISKS